LPSTKRAEFGGDYESFTLEKAEKATASQGQQTMRPKPERSRSSAGWPVFSNKWRSVVNQKAEENFDVGNICLPKQEPNRGPFG
jgi:hypothetical protein